MEKNRGTVVAVVAALIIAVVSLGVAFAAFSRNLTINGNATVTSSTWDIHYEADDNGAPAGQVASNTTIPNSGSNALAPTTQTGTLDAYEFNWSATFLTANEEVEYHFWIVNGGDYNATLVPTNAAAQPSCTYASGANQGQTVQCPLTYSVTNGTTSAAFTSSDSLNANGSVEVIVKAKMNSDYVGGESITATFPTVTFSYTQNGGVVTP